MGCMRGHLQISKWFLCFSWMIFSLMEVEESGSSVAILHRGSVQINCYYNLWINVVVGTLEWHERKTWRASTSLLWQSGSFVYCRKPSLSWEDKAHKVGLPLHSRKYTRWNAQNNPRLKQKPTWRCFYQVLASTSISFHHWQDESLWFVLPILRKSITRGAHNKGISYIGSSP